MQKSLNRNINSSSEQELHGRTKEPLSSRKGFLRKKVKFSNFKFTNYKFLNSKFSKFPNHKILLTIIFVIITATVGMIIPGRISVTTTPSLNKRVFFLSEPSQQKKIERGDYVMFMLSTRYINNGKPIRVIKKVGCAGGDTLSVKWKRYYYCNNLYMGYAKEKSKKGEPVNAFPFNGKVPDNMFFVIGDSFDSYDSKYFGFIKKEDVIKIAHPIF